jgi:acetyltransferase
VKHSRKFLPASREASRYTPVIVLKAGRAPEAARAAASHTGALAGSDSVFDAAVRRAGMLRVDTLEALFDAAETLARPRTWHGERLALVTNGGGAGVLAADALALGGGQLAALSPETIERLDGLLPPSWSRGNPVDLIGDAPVERYTQALEVLLAAPEVDGVLFMHAPTAIVPAPEIAAACIPLLRAAAKPVLTCWLGGATVRPAREAFAEAGLSCYTTPEHAVSGWLQLVQFQRNQQALLQLPPAHLPELHVDRAGAQALLREALANGREWLDEVQAKKVLEAYGIRTVHTLRVANAEQAVRAAEELGYPVALKVLSPQVLHKSDVGGVALNLGSAEDVREAAAHMVRSIARTVPQAQIAGFSVQAMALRPQGHELILGIADDPVFGPVLLFGAGGVAVEIRKDRALELPPLNAALARGLVARTRVGALLGGYRGRAPVREPALIDALLRVSQMACDLPELAELDINPLLADSDGVLALDARIRVRQPAPGETSRLALRPYPQELEETWEHEGRRLHVRPIRPEDGERLQAFYAQASPADMRLRFFLARREIPRSELARFCQIDYEREMTFVALDGEVLAGEVRAICDPDNGEAEFALQVASAWQHHGLGHRLMDKLLDYLRARGTAEVFGQCLPENKGMATLARECGFDIHTDADRTVHMRLRLGAKP